MKWRRGSALLSQSKHELVEARAGLSDALLLVPESAASAAAQVGCALADPVTRKRFIAR